MDDYENSVAYIPNYWEIFQKWGIENKHHLQKHDHKNKYYDVL